jgi:16S rRNA processing protein RimM
MAGESASPPSGISAGRIGRPHGLDGSFYVTQPRPGVFSVGLAVTVAGVPSTIRRRSGTEAKPVLALEGVTSREALEPLRGEDLWVARDLLPPLADDEFWAEDLEGCEVVDGDLPVGRVARLLGLPSCDVIEVSRPDGPDLLVPLVRDAIRGVDMTVSRIDIDLAFLGEES